MCNSFSPGCKLLAQGNSTITYSPMSILYVLLRFLLLDLSHSLTPFGKCLIFDLDLDCNCFKTGKFFIDKPAHQLVSRTGQHSLDFCFAKFSCLFEIFI